MRLRADNTPGDQTDWTTKLSGLSVQKTGSLTVGRLTLKCFLSICIDGLFEAQHQKSFPIGRGQKRLNFSMFQHSFTRSVSFSIRALYRATIRSLNIVGQTFPVERRKSISGNRPKSIRKSHVCLPTERMQALVQHCSFSNRNLFKANFTREWLGVGNQRKV